MWQMGCLRRYMMKKASKEDIFGKFKLVDYSSHGHKQHFYQYNVGFDLYVNFYEDRIHFGLYYNDPDGIIEVKAIDEYIEALEDIKSKIKIIPHQKDPF